MAEGDPSAPAPVPSADPEPRLGRAPVLRDRIVEHLKRGPDSISGVARVLSDGREAPIHRLTVAGYLQAMEEAGLLRELDRPPSKLYQLANPESHWSLHQRLHRLLQESPRSERDKARLALAVLQTLLGRPIFQAELLHAGFHALPEDLERVVVGDAVRRHYRDLFGRRGSPRIDVPARDPLLGLKPEDPLLKGEAVAELVRRLATKATGAEHLVADRLAASHQAQLDLAGGGLA
jgi:hypothetical protein